MCLKDHEEINSIRRKQNMKAQKSVLSFIMVIAMLLSVCAFPVFAEGEDAAASAEATAEIVFSDVNYTSVEGKAITRLVSLGLINGYPDDTYRPTQSMSRAEFSVVMTKFMGMQNSINPNALTGFDDIDTDENYAWARPYVKMSVDLGIISGFEDGTFRAADPVTYEQVIKMIICAIKYDSRAQAYMVPGDWSSGYVNLAMRLGITKNAGTAVKKNPTTRGTVAVLVNNALDVEALPDIIGSDTDIYTAGQGSILEQMGTTKVTGIVTGTFVTELDTANSLVPKNHIQIDDDIYEIGFSSNPNDFLGCKVTAYIEKAGSSGDYPICRSIEPHSSNKITTINADCYKGYEPDENAVRYTLTKDADTERQIRLVDEYTVIYNGKLYDYDISDLENNFTSGTVELIDNNGDNRYDIVRVNRYEVFVVSSRSTTSQKINLMYEAQYKGATSMTFPDDSTSIIFYLTRNGKEIEFSDLAKWDVLNIKESPEDAEGRAYYEVLVTRTTVSGSVQERDPADETYVKINGQEYYMSDFFCKYQSDDKPELNVGDYAQVYLDAEGKIVAAAEATNTESEEVYAYLLGVRQDSDKSEYDLEFWLYTTAGKYLQIGAAESKITIDGVKYKVTDDKILDILSESATAANSHYGDASEVLYHQPIRYATNSSGLVSKIYTVNSPDNEYISATYDGGTRYAGSAIRTYTSSSKSFRDFKVSSSTKIIYVPDDRSETDDYNYYTYSKAFTNSRSYVVEAYGLSESSKTASLVLIYGQDPMRIYTSATPFLIVSGKTTTAKGKVITGYAYNSYTAKSITVSEDRGPSSIADIGEGDVIRYIVDNSGEMIDYEVWFDASDPVQLQPCSSVSEANYNRILEIHSTSTERRTNTPSAAFRLQYGTVSEIQLEDKNDANVEKTITVIPTITEDNMDMVFDGAGVVSRTIGSSVKVFLFDRGARNSEVQTDVSLEEILDYENYDESATRVITYSASSTLRMIYIIED